MKQRILIKISGEQLKDKNNTSIFCKEKIKNIVEQVKFLSKEYQILIVVGGGNIWRGSRNNLSEINNVSSDFIGMLSTAINGIAIKDMLEQENQNVKLISYLNIQKITENLSFSEINNALNNDYVVICCGGSGWPLMTTDTASVLYASALKTKIVLIGKNNIDGVYDKDPNIFKNAKFFKTLTYDKIIEKNLKVIDKTALTVAQENKLKIFIFNQEKKNSFILALQKKIIYTEIF